VIEQDRRARDLPLDSHLHTDLSPDSDVPIDSFARQAIELGIAEIAITDHVDFQPGAPAYDHMTYAQRERLVRDAAERWADQGVAIRFGVELTYDRA
jgi:histidinol-phosphatase (PHP family)